MDRLFDKYTIYFWGKDIHPVHEIDFRFSNMLDL
jgi:hypothetical protein